MMEIDGSFGEGGGAILRVSTALSALTGEPCKIINIRKGRSQPGLKTQHLESLKTLAALCNATVKGDHLGSQDIVFYPKHIQSKTIHAHLNTAGALGLLFQQVKIPAALGTGKTVITVSGGAIAGLGAPPLPYLQNVTFPVLKKFGYHAAVSIKKHGFYPVGGAESEFHISPWTSRQPLTLTEQGKPEKIGGVSIASTHLQANKVAERQADAAKDALTSYFSVKPVIETQYVDAACPGSVIVLWIETDTGAILGADALGKRGMRSEDVGKKAATTLLEECSSGAAVDSHLSDQLLIFMALLNDKSAFTTSRLTGHAETNMQVIQKFINTRFTIKKQGKNTLITCVGSE